jgi:hypothetical protein
LSEGICLSIQINGLGAEQHGLEYSWLQGRVLNDSRIWVRMDLLREKLDNLNSFYDGSGKNEGQSQTCLICSAGINNEISEEITITQQNTKNPSKDPITETIQVFQKILHVSKYRC